MRVNVYAEGPLTCSVCAPADMTVEQIEAEVSNRDCGFGKTRWKKSSDTHFHTSETNPCVCEKDPTRRHYLLEC